MAIQRIPVFLTLLFLAAGHVRLAVSTPSALITQTCAAAENISNGYAGYDHCVGALSADPAGASAKDTRDLAVVAATLTAANVSSTVLVLDDLVQNLGRCLSIYREMNHTLAAALHDFRSGDVNAASDKLFKATNLPDDCDILLFQGSAQKNPMEEDQDANSLSTIAYSISNVVLHPGPST